MARFQHAPQRILVPCGTYWRDHPEVPLRRPRTPRGTVRPQVSISGAPGPTMHHDRFRLTRKAIHGTVGWRSRRTTDADRSLLPGWRVWMVSFRTCWRSSGSRVLPLRAKAREGRCRGCSSAGRCASRVLPPSGSFGCVVRPEAMTGLAQSMESMEQSRLRLIVTRLDPLHRPME